MAVWDGPTGGFGGTADVVRYAMGSRTTCPPRSRPMTENGEPIRDGRTPSVIHSWHAYRSSVN